MIAASIVGATGYTGAVLTDILSQHPEVRLQALTSKSYMGQSVDEVFPHLRVGEVYQEYSLETVAGSDVVFVCYPHAEAHEVVAALVDSGCRVVDLSADFRLKDPSAYAEWYGFVHPRPDLVAEAVFGLPEIYRDAGRESPPGGQPRLLSHRYAAGPAAGGGRDRRRRWSWTPSRVCRERVGRPPKRLTSARSTRTSGPTARSGTATPRRWCRN